MASNSSGDVILWHSILPTFRETGVFWRESREHANEIYVIESWPIFIYPKAQVPMVLSANFPPLKQLTPSAPADGKSEGLLFQICSEVKSLVADLQHFLRSAGGWGLPTRKAAGRGDLAPDLKKMVEKLGMVRERINGLSGTDEKIITLREIAEILKDNGLNVRTKNLPYRRGFPKPINPEAKTGHYRLSEVIAWMNVHHPKWTKFFTR